MRNQDLIDRVKSILSERNTPEEFKSLSNRHIYNKLLTSRSRLLVQELNKFRTISSSCYQSLLVELSFVASTYDPNSNALRSVNKIPSIISGRDKPLIRQVSNINGTLNIYYATKEANKYYNHNKITGNSLYYYFSDGYLYIKNSNVLKSIVIDAVFSNPLDIPDSLPFLEREFPIESSLIDALIILTLQELTIAKTHAVPTGTNDSQSDSAE